MALRSRLAVGVVWTALVLVASSGSSSAGQSWFDHVTGQALTAGSSREPEYRPGVSVSRVCFYRNGQFNRCDATPNPYQMYPAVTLRNGDVLTATDGAVTLSSFVVGGVVPTTTTTTAPTTTMPPSSGDFVETFTGNVGFDRFRSGVYHRDNSMVTATQWQGDHDLACGDPTTTSRTIRRDRPAESFYVCRDHLMTSVGDTSGYSIAWFTPNQTFTAADTTTVSWDVNVTDLGARQWWEVALIPVGAPFLATVDWVASTAGIDPYPSGAVVVGTGPFGNDGNIRSGNTQRDPLGWSHVCGHAYAADLEGCASKAIRRTFTITDNRNGTITFDYLGQRYTYPGEFPDLFEVYFKDHNYTPDKDGVPVGHTWHWDNVAVW